MKHTKRLKQCSDSEGKISESALGAVNLYFGRLSRPERSGAVFPDAQPSKVQLSKVWYLLCVAGRDFHFSHVLES